MDAPALLAAYGAALALLVQARTPSHRCRPPVRSGACGGRGQPQRHAEQAIDRPAGARIEQGRPQAGPTASTLSERARTAAAR